MVLKQEQPGANEESCQGHLGDWKERVPLVLGGVGGPGECASKAEPMSTCAHVHT